MRVTRPAPAFARRGADLWAEEVPLRVIAETVGTPTYVYSTRAIRDAYVAFDEAFAAVPHAVHYALKANSTLAVLRLLRSLGSAVDANSGGEIDVALRAGFEPAQIVFSGVGKTSGELARAVALQVYAINVESAGEADRIDQLARAQNRRARIAVRINPDIDARSHRHITTGLSDSKFGVPIGHAAALCRDLVTRPGLALVGLHVHIGSQIVTVDPLRRAAEAIAELASELRQSGIALEHLDLGGGLGIAYHDQPVPTPREYAAAVVPAVVRSGLKVLIEPGRAIVGPAGVLLARVVDSKVVPPAPPFAVLDAGMTELLRPALYGAFHRIEAVTVRDGPPTAWDIVGPLCESSDVFGRNCLLPPLAAGDLMAVRDVGAYGSTMASNYNRRMAAPEVMVDGSVWRIVRRRQTLDDLLALEESAG